MYNSSKNIFTGILCAIVVAAIVVGALFACGVFKKDTTTGTKLPIVYPDKNINWVQVDDTTLRASFDDNLNIDYRQDSLFVSMYVNDYRNKISFSLSRGSFMSGDGFSKWYANGNGDYTSFSVYSSDGSYINYRIKFVLYDNAVLNDVGFVLAGKGFVLEIGGLDRITTDSETGGDIYTPVTIEKIEIISICQSGVDNNLLN